jgi:serine protease Do
MGLPEELRRFFEQDPRFGGRMPNQQGLGSGVIVSPDGFILTNNHVIDKADVITVTLPAGRETFTAKLVGADEKTDLAMLKIDAGRTLPALAFGDSDRIEVGDLVLAVGNPFGVGQTVTSGIVSARSRGVGLADYEDFIQTDASINPGNSGGALVDMQGRLVGINTAILSPSGGNLGIGFAVPVNLARGIMDSLIAHGKVVRGYLGVMIQPLTPELAKAFKIEGDRGVLVGDVVPDGPAAKAGLKAGDVVVSFNGRAVDDPRQLRLSSAQTVPGSKVKLGVAREGATREVEITIGELKSSDDEAGIEAPATQGAGKVKLGVRLSDVDQAARERFDIPKSIEGALIVEVMPGSRAGEAGLRPGTVIVEIDRKPVTRAGDAVDAIGKSSGDLMLRVWSKEGTRYVVVKERKGE